MNEAFSFTEHLRIPGIYDFYFLRHGQSKGNQEQMYQGHHDSPLAESGRAQAQAAGEWFTQDIPQLILSSPLGRARQTAELVAAELAMPIRNIQLNDDLKEIDVGIFTGKRVADIQAEDPELFAEFGRRSWEAVPGAERIPELEARSIRIWSRLCERATEIAQSLPPEGAEGQGRRFCILSVSHGGIMQWIYRVSLGRAYQSWFPLIPVGNCGVYQLRVRVGTEGGIPAEWTKLNFVPYS